MSVEVFIEDGIDDSAVAFRSSTGLNLYRQRSDRSAYCPAVPLLSVDSNRSGSCAGHFAGSSGSSSRHTRKKYTVRPSIPRCRTCEPARSHSGLRHSASRVLVDSPVPGYMQHWSPDGLTWPESPSLFLREPFEAGPGGASDKSGESRVKSCREAEITGGEL